jgi:gamma-glutamyltranspeptidase/glutathione hydrolase
MKAKAFDQSFIFERGLSVVRQMVATHKMKSRTRDVAVATTSTLAADAAAEIAELGGNAIDCGLAAAMCSINTQPGVCALLGGDHLACAITASSGYGSGDMPNGTGLWLNNCLGELELNQFGLAATPPGRRLPSNMAPSVARSTEAVLAIGSPGADRITTALHQFFVNFAQLGLDLNDAVAHPRMHLKLVGDESTLAVEPGLDIPAIDIDITRYEEKTCTLVAWLQRWQIRKTLSK